MTNGQDIQPLYLHPHNAANEPVTLHTGPVVLRVGARTSEGRGRLVLGFLPSTGLRLEVDIASGAAPDAGSRVQADVAAGGYESVAVALALALTGAGKHDEAADILQKAVDKEKDVGYGEPPQYGRPELESLGYAYIRAGKWDQARKAFQDEMLTRPDSGHALYGIAQSYELQGDKKSAARAYTEFLTAWKNADPDLPMMEHAKSQNR